MAARYPTPDYLEALLEASRDAGYHVREQRSGQPVQAAMEALIVGSLDPQHAGVRDHEHVGVHRLR
jgi:hypothetical protein